MKQANFEWHEVKRSGGHGIVIENLKHFLSFLCDISSVEKNEIVVEQVLRVLSAATKMMFHCQ